MDKREEVLAEVESWFSDCDKLFVRLSKDTVRSWYSNETNKYVFDIADYGKDKLHIILYFSVEDCPEIVVYDRSNRKPLTRELTLNDEAFFRLKELGAFDKLFISAIDKLVYDLGYSRDELRNILNNEEVYLGE